MESKALEPAPVWAGNLEAVRWEQFAGFVDVVAAGFPCQPHSHAGSRKGTDDARWIWPAIADCIRVVRPGIVYLENVAGLRSSGGMAPVLADLAALGFRVEWDSIRASDVGASHQRERVFILAYSERNGWNARRTEQPGASSVMANAVSDRSKERISGPNPRKEGDADWSIDRCHADELADACRPRLQGIKQQSAHETDGRTDGRTEQEPCRPATQLRDVLLFAPGPNDERWTDIIAESPDLAPATESKLRGLDDGLASGLDQYRADRLRCGGNGVVALQAGLAFVQLARRAGLA
jgi:DNA (cytosine-5)-methyltransferase 1